MTDKKISALTASTTPLAGTEVLPVVQGGATVKVAVSDLTAGRDVATKNITAGTTAVNNTQVTVQASASNDANEPEFNLYSAVFANLNKPRVKSANATLALLIESGSTSTFQKRARLRLDGGGAAQATIQTSTDNGVSYVDRVTVDGATGDTTLNTGNLVPATAAKGINFTANTPAAGMTSQLLNWYEEGTWTPVIYGLTTAGVGTYTVQEGFYTRIGRLVTFQLSITITAHTGTGNMRIAGLPLTIGGATVPRPFTITYSNLTYTSEPQAFGIGTTTDVYLRQAASGAGYTDLPIDVACSISVAGSYII